MLSSSDINMKAIGMNIRRLRHSKGWVIADLAEKAGKSDNFIGQVERGEEVASLATLINIANIFEVGLDAILGENLTLNQTDDDLYIDEIKEAAASLTAKQRQILLKFIEITKTI